MKKIVPLIIAMFLLTSFLPAFAEMGIFIKEYTYQASEDDSRNSSRTIAMREIKRLLLEELGTYLESVTEVQNFQLTKDQITTLTAGIVRTEIVEEKWDGRTYRLKAKIAADSGEVIKSIDTLRKDRVKTNELDDVRRRSEELLIENTNLRKELTVAKGNKRQKKETAYNKTIKELTSIEWFEKGFSLNISGDYNDAIDAFSKTIALNQKNADAYNNRGIAYEHLGNYNQALNDYNKAIDMDPDLAEAYMNRGNVHDQLGYHNTGIKNYDKAIELNSKYDKAYYNRGIAYRKLGNFNLAIKDYDKAIELNSKFDAAYNNRGIAYENLGNYNQALNDYNRAIELNQNLAEPYVNRGNIHDNLGNHKMAIESYDRAIELNPRYVHAYYNRGITYGRLGRHNQMIADIKIAARLGLKEAQNFLRMNGIEW